MALDQAAGFDQWLRHGIPKGWKTSETINSFYNGTGTKKRKWNEKALSQDFAGFIDNGGEKQF